MSECYKHRHSHRQGSPCPYCRVASLRACITKQDDQIAELMWELSGSKELYTDIEHELKGAKATIKKWEDFNDKLQAHIAELEGRVKRFKPIFEAKNTLIELLQDRIAELEKIIADTDAGLLNIEQELNLAPKDEPEWVEQDESGDTVGFMKPPSWAEGKSAAMLETVDTLYVTTAYHDEIVQQLRDEYEERITQLKKAVDALAMEVPNHNASGDILDELGSDNPWGEDPTTTSAEDDRIREKNLKMMDALPAFLRKQAE